MNPVARLLCLVSLSGITSLAGCGGGQAPDAGENDGPGPPGTMQMAQFNYVTTTGDGGAELTRGSLLLPWPVQEGRVARGTWEAQYVAPQPETRPELDENRLGPQVGRGQLTAERERELVRINLNPQMNDNNVTLTGTIAADGKSIEGAWEYSTFAGVAATGSFRATRAD